MKQHSAMSIALLIIAGTIGAWIFSVPFTFEQTGRWPSISMVVLVTIAIIVTNLLLASVVLQSEAPKHDLVSIFHYYLPEKFRHRAWWITMGSFFVYMMIYCIMAPQFLTLLMWWSEPWIIVPIVYGTAIGMMLHKNLTEVERFEKRVIVLLTSLILWCCLLALYNRNGQPAVLTTLNRQNLYLPYGILLFALNSMAVIPLVCMLAPAQPKTIKQWIIIAWILTAIIITSFALAISWLTGNNTSPNTLSSLDILLWPTMVRIAWWIWLLAIISPHIIFGTHLRKSLSGDYKIPRSIARLIVTWWPLLASLILHPNITDLLWWTWTIASWGTALLIVRVTYRFYTKSSPTIQDTFLVKNPKVRIWILTLIYTMGILITILYFK
jgi:amino acid permease